GPNRIRLNFLVGQIAISEMIKIAYLFWKKRRDGAEDWVVAILVLGLDDWFTFTGLLAWNYRRFRLGIEFSSGLHGMDSCGLRCCLISCHRAVPVLRQEMPDGESSVTPLFFSFA